MQFILGRYEVRFKKIARRNLGRSNAAAADIGRVHSHLLRNKLVRPHAVERRDADDLLRVEAHLLVELRHRGDDRVHRVHLECSTLKLRLEGVIFQATNRPTFFVSNLQKIITDLK